MKQFLFAADFAANAHKAQRRKDASASPYINHPISVSNLCANAGCDNLDVLIAALLHDVVEDCGVTLEDLSSKFGKTIAGIVAECSDDKSLPKDERKRQQISHARGISTEAKIVKLADKLDNCRGLLTNPPPSWGKSRIVGYFVWSKAVCDELVVNDPVVMSLHASLEKVFQSSFDSNGVSVLAVPKSDQERKAVLDEYLNEMGAVAD